MRTAMVSAFALCFIAFFAYSSYADRHGSSEAEELCASIHQGEPIASARAKMKASSAFFKYLNDSDSLEAGFKAAWVEKYYCVARLANGNVTATKVVHED